ncbi:MAG: alpha/beta hydrolase [Byssovorax sp.]
MPLVDKRGVRFHTQVLGEGAPPLVMLHGLLIGNLASFYFTAAPALAERRKVLLYDLRGHGKSQRVPSGYDVSTMAGDLEALSEDLGEGPIDLCGHSYGGLIALRFALDHPGRVRRLALVETPLPPSKFGDFESFFAQGPAEMVAGLPESLQTVLGHGGRRAARLLDALRFLTQESSLLADLRAEPDIPDEVLATLGCPVLCVYGTTSLCAPMGERIARAIPGARLVMLPGGHYLHLDATEPLTRALQGFFDG